MCFGYKATDSAALLQRSVSVHRSPPIFSFESFFFSILDHSEFAWCVKLTPTTKHVQISKEAYLAIC